MVRQGVPTLRPPSVSPPRGLQSTLAEACVTAPAFPIYGAERSRAARRNIVVVVVVSGDDDIRRDVWIAL